ncbi:MAG: transcription termination factor Rho [Deltaproteobacteria bacterium]|nr:transcription termination factor Rho [Deltaproteobacteria bacterium]MBW2051987.1 transcription termination factor Rho [Deltaproteobacteria bacterium]MBW2140071.1 transcription termination factor Rho [Deltaproteobacteria bacterium]MBW2322534.1 transcription termination factor Rho [Deltaproteobacteria bacterium]
MAKKEREGKKEKPLEKMTAKELRELGLTMSELTGVHGMNKAELISAIKKVRGIVEEKKEKGQDIRELKKKIKALKEEKIRAKEQGEDRKKSEILRKKINRLKKKTRRAA